MGKWADRAAMLEGDGAEHTRHTRHERDASVSSVPNVFAALPVAVVNGLRHLPKMAVPRITRPEVWPDIVADAVRLATEGWALQALRLGWEPADIWGASEDAPGLAVWLAGRRVLGLTDGVCTVDDGPSGLAFYNRRAADRVMLWNLGR